MFSFTCHNNRRQRRIQPYEVTRKPTYNVKSLGRDSGIGRFRQGLNLSSHQVGEASFYKKGMSTLAAITLRKFEKYISKRVRKLVLAFFVS